MLVRSVPVDRDIPAICVFLFSFETATIRIPPTTATIYPKMLGRSRRPKHTKRAVPMATATTSAAPWHIPSRALLAVLKPNLVMIWLAKILIPPLATLTVPNARKKR